jgi:hypothetical protein
MNKFRHEIPKTQSEKIVIARSNYKGASLVDIRVHFKDDKDKWHPTKRGVSITLGKFEEVQLAFERIAEAIAAERKVA